jgi:hypothetical protein
MSSSELDNAVFLSYPMPSSKFCDVVFLLYDKFSSKFGSAKPSSV